MNKLRQILRLHSQGRSKLQISVQTGVARNTLKKYVKDFAESGLSFFEISSLSDKDLEDLFVNKDTPPVSDKLQSLFDLFPWIDKEPKKKGVTRQALWRDYKSTEEGCWLTVAS